MDRDKLEKLIEDILAEYDRQGNLHPGFWEGGPTEDRMIAVLTEEVGEVARAVNEGDPEGFRDELVQTITVCVRCIEFLEAALVD